MIGRLQRGAYRCHPMPTGAGLFYGTICSPFLIPLNSVPVRNSSYPMPKLNRNAVSAQQMRHAGSGSYVDENGLMLRVRDSGSRC